MNLALASQLITPDLVIDVGANQGHFYQEAKQIWPNAEFFLVDGNFECEDILKSFGVPYKIALLSDYERAVTFYTRKDSPCCQGASYLRELTPFYEGENAVPHKRTTARLDHILDAPNDKIILLKLDVQGSELDVLKGAPNTLEKCKGVIVEISFTEYNKGAPNEERMYEYLNMRNFWAMAELGDIIHPINGNIIQRDILFMR